MDKIDLKTFLNKYSFKAYRSDVKHEDNKCDTDIIRIYLHNDSYRSNQYVEFGVYDFGTDSETRKIFESFIRKDILNKNIEFIWRDDDLNMTCVNLEK